MPELPEAEKVRRYLADTSLGQRIEDIEIRDARILEKTSRSDFAEPLLGCRFLSVARHGKRLFLKTDQRIADLKPGLHAGRKIENPWVTVHLGMTGWLHYLKDFKSPDGEPNDQPAYTRLLIAFPEGCLAFSDLRLFGRIGLVSSPEQFIKENRLGPDALKIKPDEFAEQLRGKKGAIKPLLLDQHFLAGLGNLYADEALFQAGIHPETKASNLDESRGNKLFEAVLEVLHRAIESYEESKDLPEWYLLQNRHRRGCCPKDGCPLEIKKVGGRTTYYCPKHQFK